MSRDFYIGGKWFVEHWRKGLLAAARALYGRCFHQKVLIGSNWHFEFWRGDRIFAERVEENICPDAYINHVLDVVHSNGTKIYPWYLLLFSDDYTPLATDTYASPGFTEATGYNETTRPQWGEDGVSNKAISNESNKASYTMDGTDATIHGAAMVSLDTKGDTVGGGLLGPVIRFSQGPVTGIVAADVIKVWEEITGSDVAS
ncbi:hypothetical protein [uncultured Desulfosarcina sp.]|uniref:hypothetical protein n=1 Tax=uncultured Desulfosarcina sp. TaxID=218289 RepID=UPI0029C8C939|nr:hypothetical protein [uncultured Desulfosarcina sp.]